MMLVILLLETYFCWILANDRKINEGTSLYYLFIDIFAFILALIF